MTLANKISIGRIFISPLLYLSFNAGDFIGHFAAFSVTLLLLIVIEISDLVDGYIARKYKQVSEIGKILDPFADVILHTILFVCLLENGLLPGWAFLIFLLRELGAILIRMVLLSKGIALGAGKLGKIKSLSYAIASFLGVFYVFFQKFLLSPDYLNVVFYAFWGILGLGLILSILSFITYSTRFLKILKK